MGVINKIVKFITGFNKSMSYVMLVLMMTLVTLFALSRSAGYSIVGNIEIVQLLMVLLIAGALSYTERENEHISIGIIVDHLPAVVQKIIDLIAAVLLLVFSVIVCYIILVKINFAQSSVLLRIPFYPLKILLALGFLAWGLEGIRKIGDIIRSFKSAEGK